MNERPKLDRNLDKETFLSYYYLKEELVGFCRTNGLPAAGSKQVLTQRIAAFLETGEIPQPERHSSSKKPLTDDVLTPQSIIGENFVCSEKHRAFFKEHLGRGFSFNVAFQKWLKANPGKTYADAIEAYREILSRKKTEKATIDKQFEYNTYIRDFFEDNKGSSLDDAIKCWKYKKSLPGHNRYEKSDLKVLSEVRGKK